MAELEGAEGAEEGGGGLRPRRRGPGAGPRPVHVENVDGAPVPAAEALRLARRYFWAGCLGLPWLWFTNVWLFWPELKKGAASGSEVRPYVLKSGIGFAAVTAVLLAWALAFSLGGPELLGPETYAKLNVASSNLMQSLGA